MNGSMQNSTIFESMGTDGTNEPGALEDEEEDSNVYPSEPRSPAPPIEQDFARLRTSSGPNSGRADSAPRQNGRNGLPSSLAPGLRTRLVNGNGDTPSSPLSQSTRPESVEHSPQRRRSQSPHSLHRSTTVAGVVHPPSDEDGYEDPPNAEFADEVCF